MNKLTDENFNVIIDNEKCIIKFSAEWCGPCKKLASIFAELAPRYKHLKFYTMDIEESYKTTNKLNIMSVPCIFIFDHGKILSKIKGFKTKEQLTELLNGITTV